MNRGKRIFSFKRWSSYKIANFFVILMLLCFYYFLGGDSFPDYSNYVAIAENGGYLFVEDEFVAEWISRAFLKYGPKWFESAVIAVDIFAFLIQFFFVSFVFFSGDKISQRFHRGWFFYSLALAPLLITTALRASPAYLIFAYVGASDIKLSKKTILLGLLAISFHDSALIMALLYILVCFIGTFFKFVRNAYILKILVCMLVPIIIFPGQVVGIIGLLLSQFNLGIRAIYLTSAPDPSILKIFFMLLVWWVSFGAVFSSEIDSKVRLFIFASLFIAVLAFAINEVAGIRLSLYALGSAILAKGAFFSTGNKKDKFLLLDMVLMMFYFSFMVFDVLRHTGRA